MASVKSQARRRFQLSALANSPGGIPQSIMQKGSGAAADLGSRVNATTGPRAGQRFHEIVAGDKAYHVYEGPNGERQVVAVAAPPAEKVIPRLRQMMSVGPGAGPVAPPAPAAMPNGNPMNTSPLLRRYRRLGSRAV